MLHSRVMSVMLRTFHSKHSAALFLLVIGANSFGATPNGVEARDPSIFVLEPFAPNDAKFKAELETPCSIAIENKACYITLGKDGVASLPSVRVNSKSGSVEIRVYRSPLEKVEFESVTALQPEPDVGAALIKQWIEPLKALTINTRSKYLNSTLKAAQIKQFAESDPHAIQCPPRLQNICDRLDSIRDKQNATTLLLQKWSNRVDEVAASLDTVKKVKWKDSDSSAISEELSTSLAKARELLGNAPSRARCSEDDPTAGTRISAARCRLPIDEVSETRELLLVSRAVFSTLSPDVTNIAESARFLVVAQDLELSVQKQVQLESAIGDAKAAQEKLASIGDKLKDVSFDSDLRPVAVKKVESPMGTATTQIKVTATNIWNGKSAATLSPVIQWQDASWELSAGVMVSSLRKRSFAVAPILNSSGSPTGANRIVRATTTPTVVPVAGVSYRFGDEKVLHSRRSAWLGTLGIGVNDGSAEGFAGLSYSYGGLYISLGGHLGRQKELGAGLRVGDATTIAASDLGKFEKKSWVVRPAMGIAYRIPIS